MAKRRGRRGLAGFLKPAKVEKVYMYGAGAAAGFGVGWLGGKYLPAAVPGWAVKALPFLAGAGTYALGYQKLGLGMVGGGVAYSVKDRVLALLPASAPAVDPAAAQPGVSGYASDTYRNAQIGSYLAHVMRSGSVVSPGVRINGPGTYGNPAPKMQLANMFNSPFGMTFAPRM